MTDDKRKARLKRWIDDYGKYVLGTALRILRSQQDAEDVFQNTFIKAYVKTIPFKSEDHTKAWLINVASNECISILRSGWKKQVDLMDIPHELCSTSCEKSEIMSCINKLPKIYRKVVYLSYFAGYSSREIAEIENVTSSAVRSRLERARAQLKCELERNI